MRMLAPFLIKWIVDFIKDPEAERKDGLLLVGILVVSQFFAYTIGEHIGFIQQIVGVRSTACLQAIIYEKLLRISAATNKQFNQGEIVNFV